MKTRTLLLIVHTATMASLAGATPSVDVRTQVVDVEATNEEFVVSQPLDRKSVEREWQYVLRYVHNEPSTERRFSLMLVRTRNPAEYILALHEGHGMTFEEFDELNEDQKLATASAKRVVDASFAQSLYRTWVGALLRARFGDDGSTSTGADRFYLSAFGFNTGYMNAASTGYSKDATTGRIVSVGLLLKRYVEVPDDANAQKLVEEIHALCGPEGPEPERRIQRCPENNYK